VRTIIATCVGLVALSAISVQAAPLPRSKAVPTELTISPPIELAAEGCGYGQRRTRWQGHWGHCGAVAFLSLGEVYLAINLRIRKVWI
jgi:hypothetical protein